MNLQEHISSLRACSEAREWVGGKTARQAWQECKKPQWLLWWAGRTPANTKQQIVKTACEIARSVLHLVKVGEERPLKAIEAAERWVEESTEENAVTAALAALASFTAALNVYGAAYAASYAAAYASSSADAIYVAYAAAAAAAATHDADTADDAYKAKQLEVCNIIRANLCLPWDESDTHQM